MSTAGEFILSGVALPINAAAMLDEICEHFVEHSEVHRNDNYALLKSEIGDAGIRSQDGKLLIELSSPSEDALQMSRTMIAEHLFYFAGDEPFELSWAKPAEPIEVPNIYPVTVVSAENVTPLMRRVKFSYADVTPFVDGHMHIRILVPPKGRKPVWPTYRENGRIGWPEGEDKLLVRVYTIRHVDTERGELWVDFLLHQTEGAKSPGADFAVFAEAGQTLAFMGPGGGDVPTAEEFLLVGDETALPSIARIAAEVPAGTKLTAIIEVSNAAEEQALPSAGDLTVTWLHRNDHGARESGGFAASVATAIEKIGANTFVWAGCEKQDARKIRALLKARKHDRKLKYVAWFWDREHDADNPAHDD